MRPLFIIASLLVPASAIAGTDSPASTAAPMLAPARVVPEDVMPSAPDDVALDPRVLAPARTLPESERKDAHTAILVAAIPTAIGAGLIAASTVINENHRLESAVGSHADSAIAVAGFTLTTIGPALGHVYAGESGHAVLTSALRLGGAGLAFYGLLMAKFGTCSDCDNVGYDGTGYLMAGIGVAGYLGLTAYDLVDAPRAAARSNASRLADLAIVPTLIPAAGGRATGFAITGSF